MIYFDFIGGFLMIIQVVVDTQWNVEYELSIIKLFLGVTSILFDCIFFSQEYCWYGKDGLVHIKCSNLCMSEEGPKYIRVKTGSSFHGQISDLSESDLDMLSGKK